MAAGISFKEKFKIGYIICDLITDKLGYMWV